MGLLYAKEGKIFCNDYMELYVPKEYFTNNIASNVGGAIETLGVLYIKGFPNGTEGPLQLLNIPVTTQFMIYEFKEETIKVKDKSIDVMTLQYMKDSYVFHQTIAKGREVAEIFLAAELDGKLPATMNYATLMDTWWRNLEMSGVSFKVPSKIYEMLIATTYRDPNNPKKRYGQLYGRQDRPTGLDYRKVNTRNAVKELSTFSGMVFEDMSTMLTNGINNTLDQVEEPKSPLEKVIHY